MILKQAIINVLSPGLYYALVSIQTNRVRILEMAAIECFVSDKPLETEKEIIKKAILIMQETGIMPSMYSDPRDPLFRLEGA